MAEILIGNVKGPQGDTGATGATGPQGVAATVNVGTVSTTAYGNAAQVTNSGTENNAVLNFVIPQGKPGDRTTTMSALTLDTITTSTAEFPSPAVGDTGATAFGKIVKWFADGLSAIQAKLDSANVVNNLTTTETGYALDARQGKALNDSLLVATTSVATGVTGLNACYVGLVGMVRSSNTPTVTKAANGTLWTLPSAMRPVDDVDFVDAYSKKRLTITMGGDIVCKEALSNEYVRFTVTFLLRGTA